MRACCAPRWPGHSAALAKLSFYETPEEKAGALLESIVKNHPFMDGNKRTGYVLMRLLLLQAGKDLRATQQEKYDFVVSVAAGQTDLAGIMAWLQGKVVDR